MESLRQTGSTEQRPVRKVLEAPYVSTIKREAKEKIGGHERSLDFIFNTINNQAIESFAIVDSEQFPGVSFSAIKLSVTPELIRTIQRDSTLVWRDSFSTPKPQEKRDQTWFVEPAFGVGDIGNAFSALDMGIDRFIREMPKVARAIKAGETPPNVDIFVLGSPIALGGKVTEQWNNAVNETGFDAHGKLYAEFVKRTVGDNLDQSRIVVSGPSRGSVTSERTYHYLPDDIKARTQGLHDIPAANHSRNLPIQVAKSVNMGVGMAGEIGVRIVADRTTKDLGKTEKSFFEELRKLKQIPEDTKEQSSLKSKAFLAELKALGRGTPPDYSERGFYRSPDFDPVNIKIGALAGRAANRTADRIVASVKERKLFPETERRKYVIRSKGRKLIASTSRKAHNFPWKKSFRRWEQVIEYCETLASN